LTDAFVALLWELVWVDLDQLGWWDV